MCLTKLFKFCIFSSYAYIYLSLVIKFWFSSGVFKTVKDTIFVIRGNINNWFRGNTVKKEANQNEQWKKK